MAIEDCDRGTLIRELDCLAPPFAEAVSQFSSRNGAPKVLKAAHWDFQCAAVGYKEGCFL